MGLGMEMGKRMGIVMKIRMRMGPGMELGVGMKMRRMGPGMGLGLRMMPGVGLGLSSPGTSAQHWGNHCQVMPAVGRRPGHIPNP